MIRTPWIGAALLALAACAPKPETPEQAQARLTAESDSAKTAIEAALARWSGYVAAGQADSAALAYAEDAVFYSSGGGFTAGRQAIAAQLGQMLATGHWTVTPRTEHVQASGPLAVETGTYVMAVTPGPHAPPGMAAAFPDSGRYLSTWRKTDGGWLITNDWVVSTRAPAAAKKR